MASGRRSNPEDRRLSSPNGRRCRAALVVLHVIKVPCMTEINSQIAVTEGDNASSINTRLRSTDLVISDGPPGHAGHGCGPPASIRRPSDRLPEIGNRDFEACWGGLHPSVSRGNYA
jgi:hypothetical protein